MSKMCQIIRLGMIKCSVCGNWYQGKNEASHRLNINHIMRKSRI